MISITYIPVEDLVIPNWRATYLLRPELMIISSSLMEYGFIQPIHVRKETLEVIDGSERVKLTLAVEQIRTTTNGVIPVVFHDVDRFDAMMLHLRLNRGRSNLVAMRTSEIIQTLDRCGKFSYNDFRKLLAMRDEELSVMLDGSLIKVRKIKEHNYARAWVPIEAAPGSVEKNKAIIESPPNPDR